jgi:pantetheine-phosphate adenylyltransferase
VIYPGSFDPVTRGHLDVIERAARIFDHVIVAVADNEAKHPLFSQSERRQLVELGVRCFPNVETAVFNGLLVDFVVERNACAVVRGLRAISDFEFEFQLALMNRRLNERVETLFMTPRETYTFVSSRLVKEIARLGGDVSQFVPPHVVDALAAKRLPTSPDVETVRVALAPSPVHP